MIKGSLKLTRSGFILLFIVSLLFFTSINAQQNHDWLNLDTIKAGQFDNGKMWTFEYPPMDYFEETYGFRPDQEWFDLIRMSALKLATYCSASFVSEDGLVMTNHHCARQSITQITGDDEDFHGEGFIAYALEDERPVPGLFVTQLVLIKDVTDEIYSEMEKGSTDEERTRLKNDMIDRIEQRESEETGYECSVTALYNGGKYSLYGYKRYTDV